MSKEAIQKGIDALRGVIAWDIMRNNLVPYRVRDPIHEAIEALAALAEQPAPVQQEPVAAAKKDAVFSASIEFIGTLTGMKPPPIEVAPPEILKPFRDFTEKVCSIFAAPQPAQQEWKLVPVKPTYEMLKAMDECSTEGYDERLYAGHAASVYMAAVDAAPEQPAQRTWVGLTDEEAMQVCVDCGCLSEDWLTLLDAIEAKLKEKNT